MSVSPYAYVGMKEPLIDKKKYLSPDLQMDMAMTVIRVICDYYGVKPDNITRKGRTRSTVDIKHVCMYFIKLRTQLGIVKIGQIFSVDHTTIIHANRKIKGFLYAKYDNPIQQQVKELSHII